MSSLQTYFILLLLFSISAGYSQDIFVEPVPEVKIEWEKIKEKDGYTIYTREHENSAIKAIRVHFELEASMQSVLEILTEVEAYPEWVYKAKTSTILDSLSENKYYYYIDFDMPFPVWDRDNVILTNISVDSISGTVFYDSYASPDFMPEKEGTVRVQELESHWEITPLSDKRVHIDYNGMADPCGAIPAWLANMVMTSGPTKSFERFKELVYKVEKKKF